MTDDAVPNLPSPAPPEPTAEDRAEIARVIRRAARHGIHLRPDQFTITADWGPLLDSMDPVDWLAAMVAE